MNQPYALKNELDKSMMIHIRNSWFTDNRKRVFNRELRESMFFINY